MIKKSIKMYYYLCPIILLITIRQGIGMITLEYSLYNLIPFIYLNFPNEKDPVYFPINTNLEYTWMNKNTLSSYEHCEIQGGAKKININDDEYQVFPCQSEISYANKMILPSYNFFVLKNMAYTIEKREYGCGLSFKFQDEKFSFVHQLYNNHLIDQKVFAFQPIKNQKKGYLHFGGLPSPTDEYKYHGGCNVKTNSSWGCHLKNVKVGNKTYPFNINTVFQSSIDNMIESIKFFELFSHEIFKQEALKKICVEHKDFDGKFYLKCAPHAFDQKRNITFDFESMEISMPILVLFYFNQGNYFSKFSYDYKNYTLFDFGFSFFNKFNLSVFDYDDKSIKFYSENIIITPIKDYRVLKYLYYFIFTICSLFILIFIYIVVNFSAYFNNMHNKLVFNNNEEVLI